MVGVILPSNRGCKGGVILPIVPGGVILPLLQRSGFFPTILRIGLLSLSRIRELLVVLQMGGGGSSAKLRYHERSEAVSPIPETVSPRPYVCGRVSETVGP